MMNSAIVEVPDHEPDRSIALEELRLACDRAKQTQFSEMSVSRGAGDDSRFPALCALINGERGWLMFLRYEGDAGFSSRSADRPLSSHHLEFELSNGQVDEYPEAWTLPTDEVLDALQTVAATSSVPESITWWNDSGDKAAGPNDPNFELPEWL